MWLGKVFTFFTFLLLRKEDGCREEKGGRQGKAEVREGREEEGRRKDGEGTGGRGRIGRREERRGGRKREWRGVSLNFPWNSL